MCACLKSETSNLSHDEMTIVITQTLSEIYTSRIFAACPKQEGTVLKQYFSVAEYVTVYSPVGFLLFMRKDIGISLIYFHSFVNKITTTGTYFK